MLNDSNKVVKVVDEIFAGDDKSLDLKQKEAIKIMTGAKIPKNCEAVVPIEDVKFIKDRLIQLPKDIKKGANIRLKGEDVKEKEIIALNGELLNAYKLALLASQGISYIDTFKKPRVTVFATGSELKMHYEKTSGTQIYNSNTPALYLRSKELGANSSFLRVAKDSKEAIKEAILQSLDSDLIITTGGVSVGEADYTKEVFKECGMEILFSKIDIKPGKPTTLGKIGNTFVLNLPGNPLAAMVNFEIFGRFLINRLRGLKAYHINPIKAKLKEKLLIKGNKDSVIPGNFDGEFFTPLSKFAPGMVSSMAKADGFIIASKEAKELKEALFIPFFNLTSKEAKNIIST
jgi:molybdopterin molybdotransferase